MTYLIRLRCTRRNYFMFDFMFLTTYHFISNIFTISTEPKDFSSLLKLVLRSNLIDF